VIAPKRATAFLLATTGVESAVPAVTSVANQRNAAFDAHDPIAGLDAIRFLIRSIRSIRISNL
jgi:hypothetical protein